MTTTEPREIWFTHTRNGGRRANYFSTRALRSFPMPLAQAEMEIATGQAVEIPCNPWIPNRMLVTPEAVDLIGQPELFAADNFGQLF